MGGFVAVCGVRVVKASGGARLFVAAVLGAFVFWGTPASVSAQERSGETEILESASRNHVVRRGDTLWDLAGSYLSNPFGWPRIYEINTTVIEDPHWIYPGEVLALPLADAVAVADRFRDDPLETSQGDVWETVEGTPVGAPVDPGRGASWFGGLSIFDTSPESSNILGGLDVDAYSEPILVSASVFYRAPMLVEKNDYRVYGRTKRVIGGNPLHMRIPPAARLRDIVVIELRDMPVQPGDRLRAVRWHSGTRGLEIAESLAMLEVLESDGESARAVVTELYGNFSIGDPVIPAETFDIPATLRQAVDDGGLEVELIALEIEQALLSEGDMVFIDAGIEHGVRIGDEFVFFDPRDDAQAKWEDRLATARVVRAEAETATVWIVDLHDAAPERGSPGRRFRRAIGS